MKHFFSSITNVGVILCSFALPAPHINIGEDVDVFLEARNDNLAIVLDNLPINVEDSGCVKHNFCLLKLEHFGVFVVNVGPGGRLLEDAQELAPRRGPCLDANQIEQAIIN